MSIESVGRTCFNADVMFYVLCFARCAPNIWMESQKIMRWLLWCSRSCGTCCVRRWVRWWRWSCACVYHGAEQLDCDSVFGPPPFVLVVIVIAFALSLIFPFIFLILSLVFTLILLVELILNMGCNWFWGFWGSAFNIFDLIVVVVTTVSLLPYFDFKVRL